jgi:lipopolysaccharide export system protein LptA
MKWASLCAILLLGNLTVHAQKDTTNSKVIELIRADYSEFDADMIDAERIIGNVRFKQGELFMDCDSAYFYSKENRVEAFGNIYIRQKDTLNLWGDYLEYDGETRKAKVKDNVRVKDDQMELLTDKVEYDLNSKMAYYNTGGNITNGKDKLKSQIGRYYSRSKTFFFKDSVVLTNPEYKMISDTLQYNTEDKIAYFYGPTYIYSEENTIFCKNGWYNTNLNTSQFSQGASITGEENRIEADSMFYNRNTGIGQAFRNLKLTDTMEGVIIYGDYGRYHRFEKKTWISGNAVAIQYKGEDSLFLRADTLLDETDTALDARNLYAYPNTLIYRSDVQGLADSLVYSFTDSTITLFKDPIMWTDSNQITGDTIIVLRKNNQLHRIFVRRNSFTVERESPMFYNQIVGRNTTSSFRDGQLFKVDVEGNGQSLYYAKEEDSTYSGVSWNVCSNMTIKIDSNKVREITFYQKPEGTFYPINQLPSDKKRLKGFKWHANKRPDKSDFIGRIEQGRKENVPEPEIPKFEKL